MLRSALTGRTVPTPSTRALPLMKRSLPPLTPHLRGQGAFRIINSETKVCDKPIGYYAGKYSTFILDLAELRACRYARPAHARSWCCTKRRRVNNATSHVSALKHASVACHQYANINENNSIIEGAGVATLLVESCCIYATRALHQS